MEDNVSAAEPGSWFPTVGDVVDDRYRITAILGSGAMGTVFRAEHVTLKRHLAIKFLKADAWGAANLNQRFEREAQLSGRINHPNCVSATDFGRLRDGTLYLVMELADGRLLSEVLDMEERFPVSRALHIISHVLRALAQVHRANIVHRDVKPENIVLTELQGDHDFARLFDFGAARFLEETDPDCNNDLTREGVTLGTPTYMSPEQAFAQPVDGRSDLYAATIMLFEMIAGVAPFKSPDMFSLLTKHTSEAIPKISDRAPDVSYPPALDQLIAKGLAKRKEDRIASAEEYLELLHEFMQESPPPTASLNSLPPPPQAEPFRLPASFSQRLFAQTSKLGLKLAKSPKMLILLAIISLAVIMVMVLLPSSKVGGRLSLGFAPEIAPSLHAQKAEEFLVKGRPDDAVKYLQEKSEELANDSQGQLQLGHAQAALRQNREAIAAYQRAITLLPSNGTDKIFRSNLQLLLNDKKTAIEGLPLLKLLIQKDDEFAKKELVEIASSREDMAVRQAALALSEQLELDDAVDRLQSYGLDLKQGQNCSTRKKAVAKLRALSDKRAIPLLEKAQKRPARGGFLNLQTRNANECLSKDAAEAIAYLKSL